MDVPQLKKWQLRVISGLVLAPITITIVWKGGIIFAGAVALCAAICLYEWTKLSIKTEHPVIFTGIGVAYVLMSFWTCYLIREHHSPKIALLFLTMIWASDISAYIFGKTFGGPKMAPAISPNKTWAGFCGATILPGLAGGIYVIAYNAIYEVAMFPYDLYKLVIVYMAVGALIGLVGQAGDLLISMLKRLVQVKDAGGLIPGHGGLLDRVDALMLAAPVYLWIVSKFYHVFPG